MWQGLGICCCIQKGPRQARGKERSCGSHCSPQASRERKSHEFPTLCAHQPFRSRNPSSLTSAGPPGPPSCSGPGLQEVGNWHFSQVVMLPLPWTPWLLAPGRRPLSLFSSIWPFGSGTKPESPMEKNTYDRRRKSDMRMEPECKWKCLDPMPCLHGSPCSSRQAGRGTASLCQEISQRNALNCSCRPMDRSGDQCRKHNRHFLNEC